MPRKKEPPPSALPSRRSTRASNRSSDALDGSDLESLVMPVVGLGSNLEAEARGPQPPTIVISSELDKGARPIKSDARSGMPSLLAVNLEKDACQVNKEQLTVPGSNTSSKFWSASVRDVDNMADKVLERNPWKCGVFGHNDDAHKPPPPPPVVETLVMDPPPVAPPVATKKGKEIMTDGFIKVVKKNGPKPRVQIPSLNVSKPGPSKPSGRARPSVDNGLSSKAQNTHVHVSNPFSALDDTTQTEDSFQELNATLKKFAKSSEGRMLTWQKASSDSDGISMSPKADSSLPLGKMENFEKSSSSLEEAIERRKKLSSMLKSKRRSYPTCYKVKEEAIQHAKEQRKKLSSEGRSY
ncbi:hypothetical protein L1987_18707 [Smallanthus sonchifolius]|uniref:Uncharacterized protein n=1 Tax=Smallanthus sonchifolius TaxID=185202 RepID=A0ACB9J2I5_9ASTR|nr:hypothetical protein L1987_18707 [Smallanthus sonchifolius]